MSKSSADVPEEFDGFYLPESEIVSVDTFNVDISDIFGSMPSSNPSVGEFTFDDWPTNTDIFRDVITKTPMFTKNNVSLQEEINALKSKSSKISSLPTGPTKFIAPLSQGPLDPQIVVEEFEEADYGDTYDDYTPSKLNFGVKHPDSVVESSSLSVVNPPDITYKLALPEETIKNGWLSAPQLESVVYACQKHETFLHDMSRAGYLIGDGPGVGKGRIISGIIYENMLRKRTKSLWISVSNDLRFDANRDLEDVGCDVHVYPLNKISYNEFIEEHFDEYNNVGVLFSTYSSLIGECQSYEHLYKTRLDQIVAWLGQDFDGVIIFDECHKAKNLMPSGASKPTKTANVVLQLQQILPKARVIYCSATGASEPRNMAYMVRLGLWGSGTPFPDFEGFLTSVEKRGVGGMELVAIDMKQRGVYLARQLSFAGVSFSVKEVSIAPTFKKVYDESVQWWNDAYQKFTAAADLVPINSRDKTFLMAQFFSAHQRFFKTLCISSKVDEVVKIVKDALAQNKSVVIGLQSTGESKTSELIERSTFDKIISTAHGILLCLIKRHFPGTKANSTTGSKKSKNNDSESPSSDSESNFDHIGDKRKLSDDLYSKKAKLSHTLLSSNNFGLNIPGLNVNRYDFNAIDIAKPLNPRVDNIKKCEELYNQLLEGINHLAPNLPANTLDDLIDKLGGPDYVAEMTGRKYRIVRKGNKFVYQTRSSDECPVEMLNVKERDDFMDGNKFIAIISEAASSGISLQADKRAINKRKRLHLTLELSWSADRVIQQFGRTHRSNQLYPPEYLFIISQLAGEKRFACSAAKRLESLGALTHGDRRATESRDLSQFNIDTKYGRMALDRMMDIVYGRIKPFVEIPEYPGDFFADAKKELSNMFFSETTRSFSDSRDKDVKIHKFLNRLLGVKVDLQNAIYQFYISILEHCVKEAKREGKYDFGIVDMGFTNETVREASTQAFSLRLPSGLSSVEVVSIGVERGITFDNAYSHLKSDNPNEGFYLSREPRGKFRQCILVLSSTSSRSDGNVYTCSRPNTGFTNKKESIDSIKKNYFPVDPLAVRDDWTRLYNFTYDSCLHRYYYDSCKLLAKGIECDVGKRVRTVYLFCGAIFSLWNVLENTFGSTPIRMARVSVVDGKRRIGILIPKNLVHRLVHNLNSLQK